MTQVQSQGVTTERTRTDRRAEALAERLERGAHALESVARTLSDAEWNARVPGDGRKVGVIVHHVASVYPLEIQLAKTLAAGDPVVGITMADVHAGNAAHAETFADATKQEALALLRRNSAEAAAAIRTLLAAELDRAAPASLYSDAPITCQFMLEDHAVRHSYHHLARIRKALGR